jgi:NTP pyrophosphatase (non-canonical NTP hydrolase)
MQKEEKELTLNEYQQALEKFVKYPRGLINDEDGNVYSLALMYLVPALAEEAGELNGKYAKSIRDNNGMLYLPAIIKELGDVLFMVAMIAKELDIDLELVAQTNLYKLNDRLMRNQIHGEGDER